MPWPVVAVAATLFNFIAAPIMTWLLVDVLIAADPTHGDDPQAVAEACIDRSQAFIKEMI
jgi:hypothetical protein